MTRHVSKGYTLVELLIVVFILAIGIAGTLSLIVKSMISTESAWEMTQAMSHGEYILEEMQTRSSLADITSENWEDWALQNEILTLPDEKIVVEYPDAATDPLEVVLLVNWQGRDRASSVQLYTRMTK